MYDHISVNSIFAIAPLCLGASQFAWENLIYMITHEMWRKTTTLNDICVLLNATNFIDFVFVFFLVPQILFFFGGTISGMTIVTLLIQTLVMELIVVSY